MRKGSHHGVRRRAQEHAQVQGAEAGVLRRVYEDEAAVLAVRPALDYQSERHYSKTMTRFTSFLRKLDYQSERHCSKTDLSIATDNFTLDYQSKRHCSKTRPMTVTSALWLDYQSERHCSKTSRQSSPWCPMLDYQSERHCSKTIGADEKNNEQLDYQSERHCSKTRGARCSPPFSVGLPVRTTLLQNPFVAGMCAIGYGPASPWPPFILSCFGRRKGGGALCPNGDGSA